jgi:queuine/archaeosine tRNA-ribosyltransferase
MHRSHRWALRSLKAFSSTHTGKQALYGIIQGGVYRDLRDASAAFINDHSFFGTAIGGSLGADKQTMHDIVAYTRSRVRDDRPVHLLGIGGVRDIFHGVRQGIDTFDCVHPTRLGRHGGVLVDASHWAEEPWEDAAETHMTHAARKKVETLLRKELNRLAMAKGRIEELERLQQQLQEQQRQSGQGGEEGAGPLSASSPVSVQVSRRKDETEPLGREEVLRRVMLITAKLEEGVTDVSDPRLKTLGVRGVPMATNPRKDAPRTVREHVNVGKGNMRNDPRPIDSKCSCYTCKNFSRAYLHHLFKAKESIGGTLCTIHNVAFMNRLMKDVRAGIEAGTLDQVERLYVHSQLQDSISSGSMGIGT